MTGPREDLLIQAANILIQARHTMRPIDDLPYELKPIDESEITFIQDRIIETLGPIGGWKVGAGSLEATPVCAPMPLVWMGASGAYIKTGTHRFRGLEAEVAFRLKADLPPRTTPYTDEEVYAAVDGCHPAIEVLESGLENPVTAPVMCQRADLQMHGGFIHGPAFPDWRSIDFSKEHVSLAVDGVVRVEATGSNTSGNLLRLLPWLANHGAARTRGLRAGQWITTGSWTGNTLAMAGSAADVHFSTLGAVGLRFE